MILFNSKFPMGAGGGAEGEGAFEWDQNFCEAFMDKKNRSYYYNTIRTKLFMTMGYFLSMACHTINHKALYCIQVLIIEYLL